MVLRRKNKRPGSKPRAIAPLSAGSDARRERFVAEYLIDHNGTQAAIRAGYSPKTAHSQASRLLKDAKVRAALETQQARTAKKLADRYEVSAERITRELAKLGFSNMADYGYVDREGAFVVNLADTTTDAMAAVHTIKTKRTVRSYGETTVEDYTTELKLAAKREALVDLGKITGLFKDGPDLTMPVQFIVEWVREKDEAA